MRLCELNASELSKMLRNKECSAREIVTDTFDRINQVEDTICAYLTLSKEAAMSKADDIDAKISKGDRVGKLAGIPIAVKDNICTDGTTTTCASKMLENFVPPYDAFVIQRIKENDAVITGKVNMDEFAMGSSCENSFFKKTKNPHDITRVPGGSSGGSAAAVSAGEAVLSLGSDTGGSIRQPSAYCGTIGLKPTYGSVSRFGLVAFASSLDQIGPIGRSVEDVALLYETICGHDRYDATSVERNYPEFSKSICADVKNYTIGIPKEYFGNGISDEVKESVMKAVAEYEKMGAKIKSVSLPSTDYALSAYYIISSAEASSNLARYDGVKYGYRAENFKDLNDMFEKTRSEGFGDEVKRRIMLGTFVLSSGYYDAYYKKAKLMQQKIYDEFNSVFKECDMLITPTVPSPAFKLGEKLGDPIAMYAEDICTVTVNIAGLPAISIPCGKSTNGMPIGMQIIGDKFSEGKLFDAAACYEKLSGGLDCLATIK